MADKVCKRTGCIADVCLLKSITMYQGNHRQIARNVIGQLRLLLS